MNFRKTASLAIIILLSGYFAMAQNKGESSQLTESDYSSYPHWQDMMLNRDINFFETQKAFYSWWAGKEPLKGEGFSVFKRCDEYWESRVNENGEFPEPGKVIREYNKYIEAHPEYSRMKSGQPTWLELGPRNRITPLGYMGIGRVNAIAFDPADTSKIYLGAPSGGFWISDDSGETWASYTDPMPTLGVSAILVHPENSDKILIGTGDRDAGNDWGVGTMISMDGGISWEIKNEGMEERTVGMFAHHETNPEIVLAAANGGIYRTTDFGESWIKISPNEDSENFRDIKYKPGNPDVVYASSNVGFYRSNDGGDSWTHITSEEGITASGRIVIGVSPANNNLVYLVIGGTFKGCFISRDSGRTFSMQSDSPNILGGAYEGDDDRNQSWYDLVIHVDPFNANIVHTGGINMWRSDDAGVTWKCTGHWWGDRTNEVHADHHTINYNPLNNRMYLGNDGGIYYTDNQGESWTDISVGLGIGQMYKLGVSATNKEKYLAGFQDNGTATHTPDGWKTTGGGDGFECAVDPYSDQYSYTSIYYGSITRRNDRGSSRNLAGEDVNGITEKGAWVTPYCISEWDANTMIIGYKNIWICQNIKSEGTIHWEKISDNLGNSNNTNCKVVETSPADSNLFFFARHDGKLFRTDNLLSKPLWIDLTDNKPMSGNPTDFECHPYDANIVYMTIGSKVFKSYDKAETWENISGSIPELPVNDIVYDRSSNEGLYVGTDAGVFYKDASMDDWVLYGLELPASVEVSELEIYYDRFSRDESRLRASTYGRGMWEVELAPAQGTILPPYLLLAFISPYDIELAWSPPLFPQSVTGYNVYRNNEIIATTSSISYLDRKADRKISNTYKVTALYRSGDESGFTNTVEILAPISLPYDQDFEGGTAGWNAKFQPDGWNYGSETDLKITGNNGLFFGITSAYAGTDSHVRDYLYTPTIDLAEYERQTISLSFSYTLRRYLKYDHLYVLYRPDIESEWITLTELEPATGTGWIWTDTRIDLPQDALVDGMQLGFLYDDSNEHAWGAGIDNIQLFINSTSIMEQELQENIAVFPNPNNGSFEIQLELEKLQKVNIIIRDMQGRVVWKNEFIPEDLTTKHKVSITDFPKGNYQLFIQSGKQEFSNIVIIQ